MQDIIPPHRPSRERGRPVRRPAPRLSGRPVPARQAARVVSDVIPPHRVRQVTTTVTTYDTPGYDMPTASAERLSAEAKVAAMERALIKARRALQQEEKRRQRLRTYGIFLVAALLVLITGYISIDTWLTNNRVKADMTQDTPPSGSTLTTTAADEGQDEREVSLNSLADYQVASSMPRAIHIDKIDVAARVLPMGVNDKGAVQAPVNIFDAGWYNGSVKPGDIGAVFIDGHASGPTREGLFAYLDRLENGDEVQIEKGDGTKLTYRVVHTEVVKLADMNMKRALLPHENVLRGLNLMTCTGSWLEDKQTYDQRVLVYTEQV